MRRLAILVATMLALQGCDDVPGCSSDRVQPLVKKLIMKTVRSNFLYEGLLQMDKSTLDLINIRTESSSSGGTLCAADVHWNYVRRDGSRYEDTGAARYRVQLTDDGRVYVTLLE